MEKEDLEDFRKQWLSELQNKNVNLDDEDAIYTQQNTDPTNEETIYQPSGIQNKNINLEDNSLQQNTDQRCGEKETEKLRSKNQPSSSTDDYEAFKIANKYLNIADKKNCKHCAKSTKSYPDGKVDSPNILACSSKRKLSGEAAEICSSPRKKKIVMDQQRGNNDSSLVELLIADIDEITCIPFFDNELPKEIAVKIFRFLSLKDLASCALVSKEWQKIAESDLLWFEIYENFTSNQERLLVIDQNNWKEFVKNYFLEKRAVQRKWKERLCEVHDLENEKGGILCAADICDEKIVVAYLDGSIKLWSLVDGTFGCNLKEQYTSDEDIITSLCTCLCLSTKYCVATFQNGDVMIWRVGDQLSGRLVYMVNYPSSEISDVRISESGKYVAIVLGSKVKVLSPAQSNSQGESAEESEDLWKWTVVYEKDFSEKICSLVLSNDDITVNTKHQLRKQNIGRQGNDELLIDQIAGAVFSCMDDTKSYVVVGINGFGYSVLGGFRIRSYCKTTGKQLTNIVGPHCKIDCIKLQDGDAGNVVVGCSDGIIRIYDMNNNELMTSLPSYDSTVTSLQMDEWKVLSGYSDGTVVLWDRCAAVMCWQTRMKHPVYMCRFNNRLLTSVNIPLDKLPKNSNWYADDLVQHRKFRGSIRVMDFTKDTTRAATLPEEFHADYDNIAGYDYNIQLVAPYDDVGDHMNLPKI